MPTKLLCAVTNSSAYQVLLLHKYMLSCSGKVNKTAKHFFPSDPSWTREHISEAGRLMYFYALFFSSHCKGKANLLRSRKQTAHGCNIKRKSIASHAKDRSGSVLVLIPVLG